MVVGLVAMAGPAMAQFADPLGLISDGGFVPYFGSTGNVSILEVASPVGSNSSSDPSPLSSATDFHLIFFASTCHRAESVNLPLTTNDVELVDLGSIRAADGLVGFGGTVNGVDLQPMTSPVHARVLWFNLSTGFGRVLEPISAFNAEEFTYFWNPLRTGATFYATPESSLFATTIYLVCPNENVIGRANIGTTSAPVNSAAAFSPLLGFPEIFGLPPAASPASQTLTNLTGRIYDHDERFLRDIITTCGCLTARKVTDISNVYASIAQAPGGTFTELESSAPAGTTPSTALASWTGYRALRVATSPAVEVFGRLSNANRFSLRGDNGTIFNVR
jgi:hypothetical protein